MPTKRTPASAGHHPVDLQERRAGGAAKVVEVGPGLGEVGRQLGDHPLDLAVERDGAVDHVVEDLGDLLVEGEVVDAVAGGGEDAVPGG